ncbi:DUF559 domain-containing protein [Microbacterium sp. No. 7]|uniref:DUF559 domain-containing protein n=1 Tax=Microbacterium sp. No. 7 TaxID=1714373 RepID=UPI0006D04154|nr:DUF559 domain-containing protein [Microbacterium sp. No. 7]
MTPLLLAEQAGRILTAAYLTPADLVGQGITRSERRRLVQAERLVRVRQGRYVTADLPSKLLQAARLGARLDCLSLLHALGVFVLDAPALHVQVERGASRLPPRTADVIAHWRESSCPRAALTADLVEALAQSVRCQGIRDALATIDSAWHLGLVDEESVAAVFARLPRRYASLRRLLDRRAESGSETIMRLILRSLGCHVDLQVVIPAVGRVDLVVDGWLIVECDSRAHHEGWEQQKKDRQRDIAAARAGYTTVRPIAEDILHHREETLAAMKEVVAQGPRPAARPNSSDSTRRRTRSGRNRRV